MGAQAITKLLTVCLIISIIILFVLVVIFLCIYFKKRKEKSIEQKENEIKLKESDKKEKKLLSNVVQTKMYTTESIKDFMNFDEIKDNMILQNDGKRLIMVIQCNGVNYDLMSEIEKTGIEQGFSQFLNTISKPIQIHIQARKVNLEESIENYKTRLENIKVSFENIKYEYEKAQKKFEPGNRKLKDIKFEYLRKKNLYEYTKDVIENTQRLSLNQNILTTNYYVVISHSPDNSENLFTKEELLEMGFTELYTEAQTILRTLLGCGVTGKILDSVELAELLYVAYNRDNSEIYDVKKAIKSGYDALYTTAPDVIDRRIEELDKIIEQKAFDLASDTIEKVTIRHRKEEELKEKEESMDNLIKELAKSMIVESDGYFEREIIEESIEELNNIQENKTKTTKKEKMEKGA